MSLPLRFTTDDESVAARLLLPVAETSMRSDGEIRERLRKEMSMSKTISIVVIAIVVACFAGSALAAANTSSSFVYQAKPSQVQGLLGTGNRATTTSTTPVKPAAAAHLPFTGLDLAILAGAGLVLIVIGSSLHRLTRKPPVT